MVLLVETLHFSRISRRYGILLQRFTSDMKQSRLHVPGNLTECEDGTTPLVEYQGA